MDKIEARFHAHTGLLLKFGRKCPNFEEPDLHNQIELRVGIARS